MIWSPRGIAQAAEEAHRVEMLAPAEPLGLGLLELHHPFDAPVEEGPGLGLALARVVDEHRQRRGVDAGEDRTLGVMIVIGRGVAGEAPHLVGARPAELRRAR